MVLEKPILARSELVRALDPIHGQAGSELDRLQGLKILSSGISPRILGASGPHAKHAFFCSLNRDAVSALRSGHESAAFELGQHAQRIETEQLTPWLSAALALRAPDEIDIEADPSDERGWLDSALFGGTGSEELVEPVFVAAREIAEVRARFSADDPSLRVSVGRVWRIEDGFTEVQIEPASPEQSVVVGTDEVLSLGLRLGDPVVIRREELQPGLTLTTVERGLEPTRRIGRFSQRPQPTHLEELLDSSEIGARVRRVRPLRQLA
jgi:hypothetical protein